MNIIESEDFSLITLLIVLVKYKDFGRAMVNIMLIFQNTYMYYQILKLSTMKCK